jgi:hypothetical protein
MSKDFVQEKNVVIHVQTKIYQVEQMYKKNLRKSQLRKIYSSYSQPLVKNITVILTSTVFRTSSNIGRIILFKLKILSKTNNKICTHSYPDFKGDF